MLSGRAQGRRLSINATCEMLPRVPCRYKDRLEAIYTQHEERQKERVRAIKTQAGQASMAQRVKQVLPDPPLPSRMPASMWLPCRKCAFDNLSTSVLV